MERSSSGLSNRNLSQSRDIPKYGIGVPNRRPADAKTRNATPSELEKKSASTVTIAKATPPAPSYLKIKAPTKITKFKTNVSKEVEEPTVNSQSNDKKNEPTKPRAGLNQLKQSPKNLPSKILIPKQSPKLEVKSARSTLNTVRSRVEQAKPPPNVRQGSKIISSLAKLRKTPTQASVTVPATQKSASCNKMFDPEFNAIPSDAQGEPTAASSPSVTNLATAGDQSSATNIMSKNSPTKKYNLQLSKSRSKSDSRKFGSVDSVNTLGHGDHEGQAHVLTGRDRVIEKKKMMLFETVEKQLETLQTDFMNKYESLKATSSDKLKHSYKFITMVKGNDCKLMLSRDDIVKIPKKIPAYSVSLFKEKVKDAMDKNLATIVENFKVVRDIQNGSQQRIEKLEEVRSESEKQVVLRLNDLYREIDILCDPKVDGAELDSMKLRQDLKESEENNKNLRNRLDEIMNLHIEEMHDLEIEMAEKNKEEIVRLDKNVTALNQKLKQFEKETDKLLKKSNDKSDEIQQKNEELDRLMRTVNDQCQKLRAAENKIFEIEAEKEKEKDEKHTFAEKIDNLERLLEMSKLELLEFKKLKSSKNADNEKEQNEIIENLNKEIKISKQKLSEAIKENEEMKTQIEKFQQEHYVYGQVRADYLAAKQRISDLESYIEKIKDANDALPIVENSKLKAEIEKLRESESEKRRDIDKLKIELAKEHYRKVQLEEHLKKDEELLDARASLISDLQNNEQSYRQRCEALLVQNADRQKTIQEVGTVLNSELQTKSQEFRHLQESLREKCETLSRQEHMMFMLEQSNERNQKMRIKNEEKIARLEAEKRHLRDTIDLYAQNLLAPDSPHSLLFAPVAPNTFKFQHHQHQHQHNPVTVNPAEQNSETTTNDVLDDDDHYIRNNRHLPSRPRDNRIFVKKYEK